MSLNEIQNEVEDLLREAEQMIQENQRAVKRAFPMSSPSEDSIILLLNDEEENELAQIADHQQQLSEDTSQNDDVVFVGPTHTNSIIDLCSPEPTRIMSSQLRNYNIIDNTNNDTSYINPFIPKRKKIHVEDSTQELSNSITNKVSVPCPICLESVVGKDALSTICGHVYCKNCLLEALKNNKQCPVCKRKLSSKGFHNIYL